MLFRKESELLNLVEEFLKDENTTFEKIAKLVSADIINIAFGYVGNYEDAKDISQEILVKLYTKIKSFRHNSKISTWIYRITINTCIDFLRQKKRISSFEEERKTLNNREDNNAKERIEKENIQEQIRRCIEKLSLRQKNVIILKHFEGLKINQISKILGCSQSSVKTHLLRAIKTLRKEIGGKDEKMY